jgi:hypothetical protein
MICKTLSVKQPYAACICAGVKTVENRTWKTSYRGRLLIHASGDEWSFFDTDSLPQPFMDRWYGYIEKYGENFPADTPQDIKCAVELIDKIYRFYGVSEDDARPIAEWIRPAVAQHGFFFKSNAVIGECVLKDIVRDSQDDFAEPNCYHWMLADPVLYDKPLYNVKGRLRLWDFDIA